VPKTWALAAGLLEPYKGFFADKDIVAGFKKWIDWDVLLDLVNNKSVVEPVRFQVWYPNFKDDMAPVLHKMIIGDIAPKDAIQQIAEIAKAAKAAAE
jgi:ABC-type glycerol-3-phosphate transport system substrate-binding protein